MWIALNLQITFGKIVTFTILILPIHENRRSEQHYELASILELLTLAAYESKDGLVGYHCKERPIGLANFICPSTGERQGQKGAVGG